LKRLSTGVLTAIFALGYGLTSVSAATLTAASGNIGNLASPSTVAQAADLPPADFGTPPSGEVPILFNDHHVYSKPDRLKENRVLAALVRGSEILVPLRSMFEQMGATVSYDPATKTADVSKPGSDVKVTVGKPEVVINGESRPLDVPPEIYKGSVVVPVRVISEGMGAYVQWLPDRRVVVVRYIAAPPPPPPPTPAPTAPPTPVPTPKPVPPPTPTPVPTATPVNYEKFIVGDYMFQPKVYNEFSSDNYGQGFSYNARAAIEFPLLGLPWMLEGDYRHYVYYHNSTYGVAGDCTPGSGISDESCVTTLGSFGQTYVPGFQVVDNDIDARFGLKVVDPRVYIGVGYLWHTENTGYPVLHGVGFGLEKLPDLDHAFSIYGSVYYYPSAAGNYTFSATAPSPAFASTTQSLSYRDLMYQGGLTYSLGSFTGFGVFLDANYTGDKMTAKSLAPVDSSHSAATVGIGFKF